MSSGTEDGDVFSEIGRIENQLKALSSRVKDDDAARKKLMAVSSQLRTALETPGETIWRIFMEPSHGAALRIALNMGLIKTLNSSSAAKTASDLAETSGGDRLLIVRILRPLLALNVVAEKGYELYAATPISKAFDEIPALRGGYEFVWDEGTTSLAQMPAYFAEQKYQSPDTPSGIFNYARGTELGLFGWLNKHPSRLESFNTFMGGIRHSRQQWFDAFPVEQLVFDAFDGNRETPLLVDVAGGRGYDLGNFKARFPNHPGKLVLQERPETIAEIQDLHGDVVVEEYDFFTPQPIQGARAYYFRNIFHDWSNEKCLEILRNLVPAMRKGYSTLLISDWVFPDTNVTLFPAQFDILMMALISGMERTQTQWRELLTAAGLEVVKFHIVDFETEGLVEAVLR